MRIGSIKVSRRIYEDDLEILREFYSYLELVPLRVEHLYAEDAFNVIGNSPRFDELEEGLVAPEYEVIININEIEPNEYKVVRK